MAANIQQIAVNGIYIQEQAGGSGVVSQNLITESMNFEAKFRR